MGRDSARGDCWSWCCGLHCGWKPKGPDIDRIPCLQGLLNVDGLAVRRNIVAMMCDVVRGPCFAEWIYAVDAKSEVRTWIVKLTSNAKRSHIRTVLTFQPHAMQMGLPPGIASEPS